MTSTSNRQNCHTVCAKQEKGEYRKQSTVHVSYFTPRAQDHPLYTPVVSIQPEMQYKPPLNTMIRSFFYAMLCMQDTLNRGMHTWVYRDSMKPPNVKSKTLQLRQICYIPIGHGRKALIRFFLSKLLHIVSIMFDKIAYWVKLPNSRRQQQQLPNQASRLHFSDHVSPSTSSLMSWAVHEKPASL